MIVIITQYSGGIGPAAAAKMLENKYFGANRYFNDEAKRYSENLYAYIKKEASKSWTPNLSEGEAESLIHYLQQSKKFDGAYFQYELDPRGRLLRIFWMTRRQQRLYAKYSDVILQDTTNNKNRFNLPICFIACVDNEFVTRILCQAIVTNEDTVTFEFVFGHLCQATNGRNPGINIKPI